LSQKLLVNLVVKIRVIAFPIAKFLWFSWTFSVNVETTLREWLHSFSGVLTVERNMEILSCLKKTKFKITVKISKACYIFYWWIFRVSAKPSFSSITQNSSDIPKINLVLVKFRQYSWPFVKKIPICGIGKVFFTVGMEFRRLISTICP
jgi:hypothetical protein